MDLKDGVNEITENFVIVFDLTHTYVSYLANHEDGPLKEAGDTIPGVSV